MGKTNKTPPEKLAKNAAYQAAHPAIMIRPTPEEREHIKSAASAAGQSVQRYILDAVRARMDREASRVE